MNKYINSTTISTRVNKSIDKTLQDISEELELSKSQFIKDAIYTYVANHNEISVSEYPKFEKILNNKDKYHKERLEQHYMELEHMCVENSLKAVTFFDYVDKNMAEIVRRNNNHMSKDKLKEILINHLDTYEHRVKQHNNNYENIDFEKRFEWRKDEPVKFAEDKLEELAKQDKNGD